MAHRPETEHDSIVCSHSAMPLSGYSIPLLLSLHFPPPTLKEHSMATEHGQSSMDCFWGAHPTPLTTFFFFLVNILYHGSIGMSYVMTHVGKIKMRLEPKRGFMELAMSSLASSAKICACPQCRMKNWNYGLGFCQRLSSINQNGA